MKVLGIIPARYASSRFPGKPLIDLKGKSMVQRVVERASMCDDVDRVIVATDDERIFEHVAQLGFEVQMTSSEHRTGTDRCIEVLESINETYDVVINIQGDEPLLDPELLSALIASFKNPESQISTLATGISDPALLRDPSKIKVVRNQLGEALYFSRQAIPYSALPENEWPRHHDYLKHIGLYAFRSEVLRAIKGMKQTPLELAESLEQLRWMEHGMSIQVSVVDHDSISIDIPSDVEQVLRRL